MEGVMKKRNLLVMIQIFVLLGFSSPLNALTIIDFEGLSDLTPVTNQYSSLGVDFLGATVLTSGISLNEFEFPPHSGTNVVLDDSGPITMSFSAPVTGVGGYFTYNSPVTITAYDLSSSVVDSAASLYSANTALSGDSGSSPNEFMDVTYLGGISLVEIMGDSLGGSFTADDFMITPIPEPATMFLISTGLAGLVGLRRKFKR
jgi:hypothetical protein